MCIMPQCQLIMNNDSYKNVNINRKKSRLWGDIPHIIVNMQGRQLTCIVDTGCSVCVMSEMLFQNLRVKDPKIKILPTGEIMCSGAIRKQKQRVKFQVIVEVKVGTGTHDVIFLIVPGLTRKLSWV